METDGQLRNIEKQKYRKREPLPQSFFSYFGAPLLVTENPVLAELLQQIGVISNYFWMHMRIVFR